MKTAVFYGVYQGWSLTSKIISSRTNSSDTHTAIFRPDLETVIEAWGPGVTESHWTDNHTPGTLIDIFGIPCSMGQQIAFYTFAIKQLGKKYDFGGVLNFGLGFIDQDDSKWFCSELWKACCDYAEITTLDLLPHQCTPRDTRIIPNKVFVESRKIPGAIRSNIEVKFPLSDT